MENVVSPQRKRMLCDFAQISCSSGRCFGTISLGFIKQSWCDFQRGRKQRSLFVRDFGDIYMGSAGQRSVRRSKQSSCDGALCEHRVRCRCVLINCCQLRRGVRMRTYLVVGALNLTARLGYEYSVDAR